MIDFDKETVEGMESIAENIAEKVEEAKKRLMEMSKFNPLDKEEK